MNGWRPGTIGQAQRSMEVLPQASSRASAHATPPMSTIAASAFETGPAASPFQTGPATSPFQMGPAVTELQGEIAASLFRMLEGKVVGRNVVDAAGQLLAAEGTPITAELAARAEQAGLLPELVLHMTWPPEPEP